MDFTGKIVNISKDWITGKTTISIQVEEPVTTSINALLEKTLSFVLKPFRRKRSLDANAYMWVLLQKMAEVIGNDKDSIYLEMLDRYGVFTHIIVKPHLVERVKQEWRTVRELGEITVNGQTGVQLQCYFGSSTYDTYEMSKLIDGIVGECKDLGVETLPPDEIKRMMGEWGK